MWDLIVSVPDHCLSFYFVITSRGEERAGLYASHVFVCLSCMS